ILVAGCWIAVALILSPFFGIHWLASGDFKYRTAMYYHGIMVPMLILVYLLAGKVLRLKVLNTWLYSTAAIFSILFVGLGSRFNFEKGLSVAALIQIAGMVMTDILGITLAVALVAFAVGQHEKERKITAAFWLLFSSLIAILFAAPLGHLSGWTIDLDIRSFPGVPRLLHVTGMKPGDFQNGLLSSHSHLIVAATLCVLVAITAMSFGYESLTGWKRRMSTCGLWMIVISILSAMIIYITSAFVGWQPPTVFASGPNSVNGIPLDDLALTLGETGFLVVLIGLAVSPAYVGGQHVPSFKVMNRIAIFLNWICGFLGVVVSGIYIEFNEVFYGAGTSPAPGAINDRVFIRAHLVYAFMLLPIILSVLLAVELRQNQEGVSRPWPNVFALASLLGMALGLIGEGVWISTLNNGLFFAGIIVMTIAIIAGAISLRPGAVKKLLNP
ncbi:MAG: hypothetical protein ACP5VS_17200, partial [Desulfomonilaceae bacterium]